MKRLSVAVGTLLAAVLCAAPAAAGEAKTYKSPKEVFNAFFSALKRDDWKTAARCLTPDSEKKLAGGMVVGVLFMKGFMTAFADKDETGKVKETLKAVDSLLEKHGLTEESLKKADLEKLKELKDNPEEGKKLLLKLGGMVKDRGGFIGGIVALMKKSGKSGGPFDVQGAELQDVKIEGDKAKGTAVVKKGDKEERKELEFRKIGGGWRMEAPEDFGKGRGRRPGGAPPEARRQDRPALIARGVGWPFRARL